MRVSCFLLLLGSLLLLPSLPSLAACTANQYDMLAWMAPQVATQNGHYKVVHPRSGEFYWIKGAAGDPWDVDLFDARYIYQSITEYIWGEPTTFKKFEHPLPWMPRCIDIPQTPGKLASRLVPAANTNFDIHTSCSAYAVNNLGNVVNEIWGPYTLNVGGNVPPNLPTLVLSYRCDSNYSNCQYKETFAMQEGVGLVQWTLYALQNGQYVQQNQTTQDQYQLSTVTPVHPCWPWITRPWPQARVRTLDANLSMSFELHAESLSLRRRVHQHLDRPSRFCPQLPFELFLHRPRDQQRRGPVHLRPQRHRQRDMTLRRPAEFPREFLEPPEKPRHLLAISRRAPWPPPGQ